MMTTREMARALNPDGLTTEERLRRERFRREAQEPGTNACAAVKQAMARKGHKWPPAER
jgi:hypothetical protein